MNCQLQNSCIDKHLCCRFCDNKKCDQRCKDSYKSCRWFIDKEYKVPINSNVKQINKESEIIKRKRGRPKKIRLL